MATSARGPVAVRRQSQDTTLCEGTRCGWHAARVWCSASIFIVTAARFLECSSKESPSASEFDRSGDVSEVFALSVLPLSGRQRARKTPWYLHGSSRQYRDLKPDNVSGLPTGDGSHALL